MGSEIWRRELEPLGVRTITLITTSVKTPAFDNIEKPKIPVTSYYSVIRSYIEGLSDGRLQEGAPNTRTYALKVIGEVEKGTVGEIWAGKDAGVNRWAVWILPQSIFVSTPDVNCPSLATCGLTLIMSQDKIVDGFLKSSGELAKVSQVMKIKK